MDKSNGFLLRHPEKAEHNQYWYSSHTIAKIVEELSASATCVACLSTPSIYFSLPRGSPLRSQSWLFDYDDQWSKDPHFVHYDFNAPEKLPQSLHATFDLVVIDPPFITRAVWEKYAAAARLLLQPGGKVLATTVAENAALLAEVLPEGPAGVTTPTPFRPSIPHLIYQYNLFTNFAPAVLCQSNPEVPPDD